MAIINAMANYKTPWTAPANCIVDIFGAIRGGFGLLNGINLPLTFFTGSSVYSYNCKGIIIARGGVVSLSNSDSNDYLLITGFTLD